MATALQKITAEAKRMRKKSPRMAWLTAVKKASAKYRQQAKPKKKVAAVKMIERGETVMTKPKSVYRVNRTKGGQYSGTNKVGAVVSKAGVRSYYKSQLATLLLRREMTKGVRERKALSKQIAEVKKALNFFS